MNKLDFQQLTSRERHQIVVRAKEHYQRAFEHYSQLFAWNELENEREREIGKARLNK